MKPQLDMDKIAKGLGAERLGHVFATGGYFGAIQLAAEIQARFKVPSSGGRATDPKWTERRQVPFSPRTLTKLKGLVQKIQQDLAATVEPMQLAALLLEKELDEIDVRGAEALLNKSVLSSASESRAHRRAVAGGRHGRR
ncbi:MAG: hypothetical protein HY897_07305 [Deltaproteobacteria bacterium]|nr:hypothetical protein [Deltaproteobacteria bacterium]